MRKHCCACENNGKVAYCHIGRGFFCRHHRRWYKRRDELQRQADRLRKRIAVHASRF